MEQITVTFSRGEERGFYTTPYVPAKLDSSVADGAIKAIKDGQFHYPVSRGWLYHDWKYME